MKNGIIKLALGLLRVNTYVIPRDNGAILIDPGAELGEILSCLTELKKKPEYVLLTHGHYDHIGCVSELKRLGAKVVISETEHELLKKTDFMLGLGVPIDSFAADITVKDGDKLTLDGLDITVMSTPGHTPGSVCYFTDGDIAFTGDTLFCRGMGRYDLPYGNGGELMRSLKKLFALARDMEIYPGHGPTTTLDSERGNIPYAEF